ncbi:peptide-methionine (R)-S-oxide reductase MsrB [Flavobacterium sp. H122]|uniref:peptide-methionine (R)-S-oxide reductase MsrB n=1 Tax=Flavobacterium sp. H122 TaxID=2529860 RepID=UPI0010AAE827|nr:peptide-methionine (R)-S-oxide reductase MsrB [Flavobacterium sp. H122]
MSSLLKYLVLITILFFQSCIGQEKKSIKTNKVEYKIVKSDAEWKAQLGEDKYRILREKGTEYPNTGEYNLHFEKGTYVCGGCGEPLFSSDSKFESHCGWPSFDKTLPGKVEYKKDTSHGMVRTEILCAKCGGHLGHVFDDGPTKTGTRFCVNSLSIDFKK